MLGVTDLFGGGGLSTSASANTSVGQTGGGINVGGLNTGTQGVSLTTVLIIAGVALAIVVLIGRRR